MVNEQDIGSIYDRSAAPLVGRRSVVEQVASICFDFHRITAGEDVAYHASCVICRLQDAGKAKHAWQIDEGQRDQLTDALALARPHILGLFSHHSEIKAMAECIDAIGGLIRAWCGGAAWRATVHPDVYFNMQARARILRNACHNISLMGEIRSRTVGRRNETVARLSAAAAAGQQPQNSASNGSIGVG